MSREIIIALILQIAVEIGVPPYFALSIALTENPTLNPNAVSPLNRDGSRDRGLMQLNNRYFVDIDWRCPETNIRAGIGLIKRLMNYPGITTFFDVAVSYNCGHAWLVYGYRPPESSIDYANKVMQKWQELEYWSYINPVIQGRR